jgi:hypothetical protein
MKKKILWSKDLGMRRRSWLRRCQMRPLVAILATTVAPGVCAEAQPTTTRTPVATVEGRRVATELPPEVKRLIDAARRLHEERGLILDRRAIYKALGAPPEAPRTFKTTEGSRSMAQELVFEPQLVAPNWQASLNYSEYPESASWSVRVQVSYSHGPNCYPSRLVEAYWGKPFVYRPLGVHAFMDELRRQQVGAPQTGPHDGEPYNAGFFSAHANGANVSFSLGPHGCLFTISMSNLFKLKEYSDENIYHE